MTRSRNLAVPAATALLAVLAPATAAAKLDLTVVHFNDLDRMNPDDGRGGVAKVAKVIEQARADNEHVLVTHGGDTISPSLLSGIDKGKHMIDLLNRMEIDVMAAGNHEFDFGPKTMAKRVGEADFPVVSANARAADGEVPDALQPSATFDMAGWQIGVVGLTTPTTTARSSPEPIGFTDPVKAARQEAKRLRNTGADFVLGLAHTTVAEDQKLIDSGALPFILGGDDHDLRVKWFGGTGFVESLSQGDLVTVIDFTLTKGEDGTSWSADYRIEDTRDVAADADLKQAVAKYNKRLDEKLNVAIGTTETKLDTGRQAVRTGENAFGNLVVDAMRQAVDADVAITNGGGIRGDRTYPAGTELTRRDIQTELPFGNRTVKLRVTGKTLRQALENGLSRVENVAGRFPHVAGMTVRYDLDRPRGERVQKVTVGGEALEPDATYTLATNNYMAGGGDGYTGLTDAEVLIDASSGDLMASQVMAYIEQRGTVAPKTTGRLQEVD